jgi:hypothetical protein
MSYTINKTTGEVLITIPDGTADGPDINPGLNIADLDLFGKNYPLYGELQNENFIKLLQNFANTLAPANPLQGELWYDLNTHLLKIYNGTIFVPVSPVYVSPSAPVTSLVGTQWWDSTNYQLNMYNGTGWSLVGPAYKAPDGKSGALVEDVFDTNGNSHTIIKFYTNNNVSAIVSYDQPFVLGVSSAVTGFSTISPGITLCLEANNLFYGTATNSQNLGNIAAINFARNDIDSTFYGNIAVGYRNLSINTTNSQTSFINGRNNAGINFHVNAVGVDTQALSINGATGEVSVAQNPVSPLGVVTKQYSDNSIAIAVSPLAPTFSPSFTGVPLAPNVAYNANTAQVATMNSVQSAITFSSTAPWLGSQKTVSTATPVTGTGNPGDFWFQI